MSSIKIFFLRTGRLGGFKMVGRMYDMTQIVWHNMWSILKILLGLEYSYDFMVNFKLVGRGSDLQDRLTCHAAIDKENRPSFYEFV